VPRFDVYGRLLRVEREEGRWVPVYVGSGGTRRVAHDVVIPPDLPEDGLDAFLSDHFHESATPDRPDVVRLD
jgi:hypothetical protein